MMLRHAAIGAAVSTLAAGCVSASSCAGLPTPITANPSCPSCPACAALADRVDPLGPVVTVRTLAASPRYLDEQRAEARAWLVEAFARAGRSAEAQPFEISGLRGVNLVARGAPGAKVLVAAHYDTVEPSPGADDNASGVAAALEVARALGPDAPVDVVLFDLEEPQGSPVGAEHRNYAYGSQAFVDAGAGAGYAVVLVLESVGYRCDACQRLPARMPADVVEADGNAVYLVAGGGEPAGSPWTDLLAAFGAGAAPTRAVGVFVPYGGGVVGETRFSDHAPFWDIGVPAVMVTDTALLRNPAYHRPGDRPDRLDPAFLAAVARGATAAAAAAADLCGG